MISKGKITAPDLLPITIISISGNSEQVPLALPFSRYYLLQEVSPEMKFAACDNAKKLPRLAILRSISSKLDAYSLDAHHQPPCYQRSLTSRNTHTHPLRFEHTSREGTRQVCWHKTATSSHQDPGSQATTPVYHHNDLAEIKAKEIRLLFKQT